MSPAQRPTSRGAASAATDEVRTLRIERLAAGGDGVARDDGLVVFVPRTAPGDVAEVAIARTAGARFARGRLVRLVEHSQARVAPECPHYVRDACGGCQLQHLAYDAQVHAKAGFVADAFQRIAKRTVHVPEVHAAAHPWRYRAKLTLALERRRDGGWRAGLHPHDDPVGIFELDDCRIADARVVAAWRAVLAAGDVLPPADRLRGAVRLLDAARVAVVIEGGASWPGPERLLARVPAAAEVWWRPERGHLRRLAARESRDEAGASFVQVNAAVADALRREVVARIAAHAPRTVVDAYAGVGDVAEALAARGIVVTAIERDAAAAAAAARRLAAPSQVVAAAVEDALAAHLPADVILLNPPRTGLHADVPALLAAATPAPRAILYVSCDPATLARDVARLPGWGVARVTCYDMFPQTAHVETVCELVPEAA